MKKWPLGLFLLSGISMQIAKIEPAFFVINDGLVEILDKGAGRGYGIAVITVGENLKFGIPLRSNMKHKSGFLTVERKGLDFSKAVLIEDDAHIGGTFKIPAEEYKKIQDREHFITKKFQKYVDNFIKGVKKNDANILREYRFSTLHNYNTELGC